MLSVLQFGLPEFVPDLIAFAGGIILLLALAALGGTVYQHLTGGVEWPEDEQEDEESVSRGGDDDEWDYY